MWRGGVERVRAAARGHALRRFAAPPQSEAFGEWYASVIVAAELIDYYDVSGCYILRCVELAAARLAPRAARTRAASPPSLAPRPPLPPPARPRARPPARLQALVVRDLGVDPGLL